MLTSPGSSSAPRAYSSSLVSASRSSSGSAAGLCGCAMAPPRGSAAGVEDRGAEGVEGGGASAGVCGCVLAGPRGSAEGVDERGGEGVEIVGGAGGDEAEAGRVVDHHLLGGPAPARVGQVGADGGDGGEFAAVRQARLV